MTFMLRYITAVLLLALGGCSMCVALRVWWLMVRCNNRLLSKAELRQFFAYILWKAAFIICVWAAIMAMYARR